MAFRTNGFSDQWVVGPMGFRTNGSSDQWAIGPSTLHPLIKGTRLLRSSDPVFYNPGANTGYMHYKIFTMLVVMADSWVHAYPLFVNPAPILKTVILFLKAHFLENELTLHPSPPPILPAPSGTTHFSIIHAIFYLNALGFQGSTPDPAGRLTVPPRPPGSAGIYAASLPKTKLQAARTSCYLRTFRRSRSTAIQKSWLRSCLLTTIYKKTSSYPFVCDSKLATNLCGN